MTNTITYPAAYHVLSCDEMTYTEGGIGVVQAAMAWFPLYGWYKAVSTIHDYRKANINSNWVENGMNALAVHAEKSSLNAIHGDMYVKCEVEIPKKLNKTQREALKKFEGTLKEENYEKRKGFFKKLKDMFNA